MGYVNGAWNGPFICEPIFERLKRDPAAVCGMTVDTGLDTAGYSAATIAILGATATVHCEGNPAPYVALRLCSSACMLRTVSTCCKVPSDYACEPRPPAPCFKPIVSLVHLRT